MAPDGPVNHDMETEGHRVVCRHNFVNVFGMGLLLQELCDVTSRVCNSATASGAVHAWTRLPCLSYGQQGKAMHARSCDTDRGCPDNRAGQVCNSLAH